MSDRERIEREYAAALDAGEGVVDVGRTVLCDSCSTDLTDDPRSGGFLFDTYAYGPCCAEGMMSSIKRYGEESFIEARCPDNMPFGVWVRRLRGPDPKITVNRLRS